MNAPNHSPGPHPVAVADPAQWLRIYAEAYKGENRATLDLCASKIKTGQECYQLLKEILQTEVTKRWRRENAALVNRARGIIYKVEGPS